MRYFKTLPCVDKYNENYKIPIKIVNIYIIC